MPASIDAEPAAFRRECARLLLVLMERMDREDHVLYPLVDAVYAPAHV